MSCQYCGGDRCGSSAGGSDSCDDSGSPTALSPDSRPGRRPDSRVTQESPVPRYGPFTQTRGYHGELNTWDGDGNLVRSEQD